MAETELRLIPGNYYGRRLPEVRPEVRSATHDRNIAALARPETLESGREVEMSD